MFGIALYPGHSMSSLGMRLCLVGSLACWASILNCIHYYEYLTLKEWDSIDGDKRRESLLTISLQTCIACQSTGRLGHLRMADPKKSTIVI